MPSKYFRPPQVVTDQMRKVTVSSSVSTEIPEGTIMNINSDGTASPASGTPNFPLYGVSSNLCSGGDDCYVTLVPNPTAPSGGAPINSPAFTGIPTAPTAAASTDTTQIATTAMVQAAIAAAPPPTGVLSKSVTTLTAAQMLALNTVPVDVVPAGGAGMYINVVSIALEYKHVTTGYSVVGSDQGANFVFPGENAGPYSIVAWVGFIDQFANQIGNALAIDDGVGNWAAAAATNAPLQLVSNNLLTTGDGTLTTTVYYTLETA